MKREHVPLILEQTDMPDLPGRPPIAAYLSVVGESLHIRAERTGTLGADVVFEFDLPKDHIRSVAVKLVPDVPEDFEYSPWNQPELSTATVIHRDPYEVVPEFRTIFGSTKSYWIRALQKMLRDELNVDVTVETEEA